MSQTVQSQIFSEAEWVRGFILGTPSDLIGFIRFMQWTFKGKGQKKGKQYYYYLLDGGAFCRLSITLLYEVVVLSILQMRELKLKEFNGLPKDVQLVCAELGFKFRLA